MADEHAQFEILISNLLNTDNEIRVQSEAAYESVPDISKIPFLIRIMSKDSLPVDQRSMSAVLLRRLYTNSFDEFWPTMEPNMKERIKEQHIFGIQAERLPLIRKKMVECATELARNFLDEDGNNSWPEILKFIFESANSPEHGLRESSLTILSIFPGIFGKQQSQYMNVIKEMLGRCLTDTENRTVRVISVKATVAIILNNENESEILNGFQDLMPGILHEISNSFTDDNEDDTDLLKSLIDLCDTVPKFIRPQFDNVITLCMKIVGTDSLKDETRQLALEVIVTLAENAPAMVRKFDKFLNDFVPQILSLMCEMEDDEDWSTNDDAEDEDNETNNVTGESALDRLACSLGGKTMLPHILTNVPPMLQNQDWKFRHAALMALSSCGEGCHKQMQQMLPDIMDTILPFLQDPHPRVRYALCNAIGQMSTDFGSLFQKKFHEKVIPGLLSVMVDFSNPRVQAHAAAALLNFCEECPKLILVPYLDGIIIKLELVLNHKFKELMEKGTKLVLEQCVTTLASVADCAEEKFIEYYDRFIPSLKYIINHANEKELRLLRGKTIECISLIGLAVGKEKFMSDCSDIMSYLLKSQTDWDDLSEDDPQISYMISAWARMCKILGKDFEQYLPQVMGPVLKAASIKPEVAVLDADDMKSMEDDPSWQFVTLGEQQSFGIRTAGLEEKATACQMLVCYAKELKEAFSPYADEVVKIMVSHIKFYFHDGVRSAATDSLPYLLECASFQGEKHQQDMWQYICPELMKAIESEPDNDIKSDHLTSMSKCIETMGKGCFDQEQLGDLSKILFKILNEHFERQIERHEKRKDEDYDDDVEDVLLEEDDEDIYLLSRVTDILHALLTTHKETILPFFDQLLPMFSQLIGQDRPWADRQWSLCIFDDLIENIGPLSLNYQQFFLSHMIQYITDPRPEIRQAASYGIGLMAQYGGNGYTSAITQSLPLLLKVIQDPESRSENNLNPTENCISAVTKICKFSAPSVNVNEVLPHWLGWLPVWEDHDEVLHVYGYLCDLIESNNPAILGENNSNLPRIVLIIAESLVKDSMNPDDEVYSRLLNIVAQLQANSGEIFSVCVSQLNTEQQAALKSALQPLSQSS